MRKIKDSFNDDSEENEDDKNNENNNKNIPNNWIIKDKIDNI